jgi:hypothetical protein
MEVPDITGELTNILLPPEKSARPNLSFKEIEVQHLSETVYFAGKPVWKPVNLTLYDLSGSNNPVFEWIKCQYEPNTGVFRSDGRWASKWKKNVNLKLYDGCGNEMEAWIYENAWPSAVEWGSLDMADNEYVTIELTLRYDRAYIL